MPRPQENKQIRAFPLGRQPAGSGKGGMAASGVCRTRPPAGQPVPFLWDRRAQASLARSPAALSFPARSHSAKTPWVQHPHPPSALRLPSSEKEGIGGRCNVSFSLCPWVTSSHGRKNHSSRSLSSAHQVGRECRGQRASPFRLPVAS